MGLPAKERQVKHLKTPGKILFSEAVRKINLSNHEQNPLSELRLGVKLITTSIGMDPLPEPHHPPHPRCNEGNRKQKSPTPSISKGRCFPSLDSRAAQVTGRIQKEEC